MRLSVLLLHEGVGDGLHAILWADEHHRGATTHHKPQLPSVLRQLVLVIRVWRDDRQEELSVYPSMSMPQPGPQRGPESSHSELFQGLIDPEALEPLDQQGLYHTTMRVAEGRACFKNPKEPMLTP